MRRSTKWWVWFFGVIVAPFVLVTLTHELAMIVPGTVKVIHWEVFASIAFIVSVILVAILISRAQFGWLGRVALGLVTIPILLLSSFVMQVHSNCGPLPTYIGDTLPVDNDDECG